MTDYQIFGGVLRSALEFPELRVSPHGAIPTWTLTVAPSDGVACPPESKSLGKDVVDQNTFVRLFDADAFLRMVFDDTGVFDVSRDGTQVIWYQPSSASIDAARTDIMGRVLALALHARGMLVLHGSAVAIGDRGIGFLAPKHHGKSTLAGALTSAGARLATDDTLAVEPASPTRMWPGVHRIRLWQDSVSQVGADVSTLRAPGDKLVLEAFNDHSLLGEPCAMNALYLLAPRRADAVDEPVRRTRLEAIPATLALIRHAKLGPLLGGVEAQRQFACAASVAARVPVYSLEIVRDFEQLDDVVKHILAWHGREPAMAPNELATATANSS